MTDQQQPKRYSRSARIKGLPQPGEAPTETTTDAPRVVEHAKKGFTALQKVIALISTCLSVIVASITISNNLNKDKAATTPSTETRVTHIYKTETTVVSGSQSQPSSTQSQKQAPASSATPSTSSSSASSQTSSRTITSTTSSSSEATNSSTTASTQSSTAQNESAAMTGSSEVVGTSGSSGE